MATTKTREEIICTAMECEHPRRLHGLGGCTFGDGVPLARGGKGCPCELTFQALSPMFTRKKKKA